MCSVHLVVYLFSFLFVRQKPQIASLFGNNVYIPSRAVCAFQPNATDCSLSVSDGKVSRCHYGWWMLLAIVNRMDWNILRNDSFAEDFVVLRLIFFYSGWLLFAISMNGTNVVGTFGFKIYLGQKSLARWRWISTRTHFIIWHKSSANMLTV